MTTIHIVPHTHWDREWYLPFQVFRLKLVKLIDDLLDLMHSDPGYRYFMLDGQTIVLEDYLEMRPEREEELRQLVQAGRLLIGPWHVLPDEFLVSPEALVRNLLEGKRVSARFGPSMPIGYIPDPFGHIGQMPQILRGFGMQAASLQRGLDEEPCHFWWQSPDGSQVFMAYLRDGYGNAALLPNQDPAAFAAEVRRLADLLRPHSQPDNLLLMYGTDHTTCTPQTSELIAKANALGIDDRLLHSTLPAYIAAVQEELSASGAEIPTVHGELRSSRRHNLLPGVLSSRAWIKQRNHQCEILLEKWSEPFSAFAGWVDRWRQETKNDQVGESLQGLEACLRNPQDILRQAWRLLLECQPHDSICGCSIDQVHEEMRPRFDQVEQIGEEITRQSLTAIAEQVDTQPPQGSGDFFPVGVVVYNPEASPQTGEVSALLPFCAGQDTLEIVDAAGNPMPVVIDSVVRREMASMTLDKEGLMGILSGAQQGQLGAVGPVQDETIQEVGFQRRGDLLEIAVTMAKTREANPEALAQGMVYLASALADSALQRFEIQVYSAHTTVRFVAHQIPGFGYRTFWVRKVSPQVGSPDRASLRFLENEFFRLEASKADGTLTMLDKESGLEYRGLNRFVDGGDRGDTYNYSPPADDRLLTAQVAEISYKREAGFQSVKIVYTMDVPERLAADRNERSEKTTCLKITSQARLLPGVRRVEIHTIVENSAEDHRLRVHFPFPFEVRSARYDGHYQVVERPVGIPAYDDSWTELPRPEQPQRAFVDVSRDNQGLMVANRGLREVEVIKGADGTGEIALTLLRCMGWLSRADFPERKGQAGPELPVPGAQMPGSWSFDYALIPHHGIWQEVFPQAYAFNSGLRAAVAAAHPGWLPNQGSLLAWQPVAFLATTVKAAEDGEGWVLRGYNSREETVAARIKPLKPFHKVIRSDLAEREGEPLTVEQDGQFSVQVSGYQILTLRVG